MKIWIDALTPKQVLFTEPLLKRLQKKHKIMVTSRNYREAVALIKQRGMKAKIIGKFGGKDMYSKLITSIDRESKLLGVITKFNPDLSISYCSPECARISFGLGIKHYAFCNTPKAYKVLKLTLPLIDKLFIPKHLDSSKFTEHGIDFSKIFKYDALDEMILLKNKPMPKFNWGIKNAIVIRTVESKASYELREFDIYLMIKKIRQSFPSKQIVVLPRYEDEMKLLRKKLKRIAIVPENVLDSKTVLDNCDVFIGSGGTMTKEAMLRGVPTISINTAPNDDEEYLVKMGLIHRAETLDKIIQKTNFMLIHLDKKLFKNVSKQYLGFMENPHIVMMRHIRNE